MADMYETPSVNSPASFGIEPGSAEERAFLARPDGDAYEPTADFDAPIYPTTEPLQTNSLEFTGEGFLVDMVYVPQSSGSRRWWRAAPRPKTPRQDT